jgi:membrane protease YdiL (CAAX protease family)
LARRTNTGKAPSKGGKSGDLATQAAAQASDKVTGWSTLVTGIAISAFLYWRNHPGPGQQVMGFSEYNLLNTAFILWVPLLVILIGLKREPSEFGMTGGDLKWGMRWAFLLFAAFIPVILLFSPQAGPQGYYLNWMGPFTGSNAVHGIYYDYAKQTWSPGGQIDWARLAYHELAMGFYMFGWEFFFRGYLLNGIQKLTPLWGAILIQALIFTGLHWGKPYAEVASSFPGGILMALLAVRFKSFLPCFVLHWLISMGFDFAVLYFHFRG